MTVEDRWLGVEELAEYLGVSRETIYAWLTKGAVPGHRIGKLWKFKREEVDDWVRGGHAAGASAPRQSEHLMPRAKKQCIGSSKGRR